MIMIYSADENGNLYTDPKQRAYIDAEILRDRAVYTRTNYVLNRIAQIVGFRSYSEMETSLRCSGVTKEVLDYWVLSGTLVEKLKLFRA